MTTVIEGPNSFFISAPAVLVDESKDVASNWASEHIVANDNIKWVLAKYVEADNANSNGQYFSLDDLRIQMPTVNNSPMNIDHRQHDIVGTWTNSELLYPTDSSSIINPYVEVLGAFWRRLHPERLVEVEEAYNAGALFVSMEAVGQSVTCVGTDDACGQTFPYAGPLGPYCEHINDRAAYRQIDMPHFAGGALIVPPNKPGWKSASVNELSNLVNDSIREKMMEDAPEMKESDLEATLNSLAYMATLERFSKLS